jgi:hypothetical protein
MACSSQRPIGGRDWRQRLSSTSSKSLTRPNRAARGWGYRSAFRSSKRTADDCGRARRAPRGHVSIHAVRSCERHIIHHKGGWTEAVSQPTPKPRRSCPVRDRRGRWRWPASDRRQDQCEPTSASSTLPSDDHRAVVACGALPPFLDLARSARARLAGGDLGGRGRHAEEPPPGARTLAVRAALRRLAHPWRTFSQRGSRQ